MVERSLRMREAQGSIPCTSIVFVLNLILVYSCLSHDSCTSIVFVLNLILVYSCLSDDFFLGVST